MKIESLCWIKYFGFEILFQIVGVFIKVWHCSSIICFWITLSADVMFEYLSNNNNNQMEKQNENENVAFSSHTLPENFRVHFWINFIVPLKIWKIFKVFSEQVFVRFLLTKITPTREVYWKWLYAFKTLTMHQLVSTNWNLI